LEQVSSEDDNYYYEKDGAGEIAVLEGDQKRVLGLGLALVARIVRNMDGQLSVKSEEGKGSRFKISLRFPEPEDETTSASAESSAPDTTGNPATPPTTEGEILLVDSNARPRSSWRHNSADSSRSGNSLGSSRSARSEADRLISAIQEPALVNKSETSDSRKSKHGSPESSENKAPKSCAALSDQSSTSSLSKGSSVGPIDLPNTDLQHLMHLGSPVLPGQEGITDSGVPLCALRIDEADVERPSSPPRRAARDRASSIAITSERSRTALTSPTGGPGLSPFDSLHVLVAEDDPVNSKIVQKRLERFGHSVHMTVNGEECAIAYRANATIFDAVLMDIQVSIQLIFKYT
jgi:CheY-like chemotaxis protein